MNKEQYEMKKEKMRLEAQGFIDEGKAVEANAKIKEIEQLTSDFQKAAIAQANLDALSKVEKPNDVVDLENKTGSDVIDMTGKVVTSENERANYEDVFAKVLMGKNLDESEAQEYARVNNAAYTHQTTDQDVLIPETVVGGIMGMISEQYPFFGEVRKMNVKGKLVLKRHTAITQGDASFVDEGTPAEDEKNTFAEVILNGHEVAKLVRVSFKLEAMSIPEFISYIQTEISDRIGYVLGHKIFTGTGTKEPKGLLVELAATGTTQVVTSAVTDKISYADLTMLRSKIASQFASGLKFYAKSATIWNSLANILDTNEKPVFVREPVEGGVGTIFGIPVVEDDGVPENELVLGNPFAGMIANTNEPLAIQSQKDLIKRETVFLGYTIIDWTVTYVEAFAHLKIKAV